MTSYPVPGVVPTAAQMAQLQAYAALLRQWNPKINLVAPSTLPQLEQRHVADSAQLVPHLPIKPSHILDIGSGAGLPGLILAILAPQHHYTLAERDQRKAAFLRTAVHTLGLTQVQVHAADVAELTQQFNLITARAFANLGNLLRISQPLLVPQGCWLLLKGQALPAELSTCETLFHLTTERWPSIIPAADGGVGWVVKLTPSSTGNPTG